MGTTHELDATAEAFHCGLLAAQTSAILERQPGAELSSTDREVITTAQNCIQDLIGAARTLGSKPSPTINLTPNAIKLLGFALPLIQRLPQFQQTPNPSEEIIIAILAQMEQTLNHFLSSTTIPAQTQALDVTRMFFGLMADYQLSSLNRARMRRPSVLDY